MECGPRPATLPSRAAVRLGRAGKPLFDRARRSSMKMRAPAKKMRAPAVGRRYVARSSRHVDRDVDLLDGDVIERILATAQEVACLLGEQGVGQHVLL